MVSPLNAYKNFKCKLAPFIELTRAYTLLTSMTPWFVAAAFASVSPHFYSDIKIKLLSTFLTFIGVICVHLGGNLFDDFIDVKNKLKEGVPLNDINFENAKNKARLIINGTYSFGAVKKILIALFGTAVLIGAWFTYLYGVAIPIIAGVAGVLCLIYPHSAKFYMSEIIIGFIFGPLLINGTFLALTGRYSSELMILSVGIAFLIVVLLDTHSLMDFDYDKRTGKKTLCILAGGKKQSLALIGFEILAAYIITVCLVLTGKFSPWILAGVIVTLPLSVKLIFSLNDYNNVKDLKFIPKWYLGPMENWDLIKAQGYEYFMYRFYIARNIGFIYCVIIAIVCFFTVKINYIYI